MNRIALALLCLALTSALEAQLAKVSVSRAQLTAVTGTARITDLNTAFWTNGVLKSRVYRGQSGTPAAGLYIYEYSLDLRNVVGVTAIPQLSSVVLDFGPIVGTLDFNVDNKSDELFIIKGLGLGNVAPSDATQSGASVTFAFKPEVGGGGAPGNGDRSYVFGLVSKYPPHKTTATAQHNLGGSALSLSVQTPNHP